MTEADLATRILEALRTSQNRVRTASLLDKAQIVDRSIGEDVIWSLIRSGEVTIGPDSTLRMPHGSAQTSSSANRPGYRVGYKHAKDLCGRPQSTYAFLKHCAESPNFGSFYREGFIAGIEENWTGMRGGPSVVPTTSKES